MSCFMRRKYKENNISIKLAGLTPVGVLQRCSDQIRTEICANQGTPAAKHEKE